MIPPSPARTVGRRNRRNRLPEGKRLKKAFNGTTLLKSAGDRMLVST